VRGAGRVRARAALGGHSRHRGARLISQRGGASPRIRICLRTRESCFS
jgi:hypothetical protein